MDVRSFDSGRILLYDFFSGLFLHDLLVGRKELLEKQLEILLQSPLEEGLEIPLGQMLSMVQKEGMEPIVAEYTELFVLPFTHRRIHLLLSHYKEGYVGGQALLDIRQRLRDFPIRMNEELCKESEEHFGFLLVLMRFLIENHGQVPLNSEVKVFKEFIAPYGEGITQELISHPQARFYASAGKVLASFLGFERNLLK